jgi:uncharacterized protein YgbK (DUF1537 family)
MIMGVVADDITGSNDIGSMFAKAGYLTHVYSYTGPGVYGAQQHLTPAPDVVILDTNSRLDAPGEAYRKVFDATKELLAAGCTHFHNKTCSVFRGNIGAEFDAMLDALGLDFAVVILGFPKNGRTTINGIHYVHGVPLAESEFKNDPVHPMRQSSLVDIVSAQTSRKVGLIDHAVIAQGSDVLRGALDTVRGTLNYVILDVANQEALETIAHAVVDEPVLCGSSAIAEELPAVWTQPPTPDTGHAVQQRDGLGILCAAGSLMPQTAAQITYLRERGTPTFELDPLRLFDENEHADTFSILAADVMQALVFGESAVLHTTYQPDRVGAIRAEGTRRGVTGTELSRLVSHALAEVVAQIVNEVGLNRLLVAGGETSNAVCNRLNITGLRVWQEIQPGLPSCVTLTDPPMLLVLKSGSFGSPSFFAQAIDHLKQP